VGVGELSRNGLKGGAIPIVLPKDTNRKHK
jgi:hypothetical protein